MGSLFFLEKQLLFFPKFCLLLSVPNRFSCSVFLTFASFVGAFLAFLLVSSSFFFYFSLLLLLLLPSVVVAVVVSCVVVVVYVAVVVVVLVSSTLYTSSSSSFANCCIEVFSLFSIRIFRGFWCKNLFRFL